MKNIKHNNFRKLGYYKKYNNYGGYSFMELGLWVSILPPLSAIILAMLTKQVIPSLLIGLLIGSFFSEPGIFSPFATTISYIIGILTDSGNMDVLLFLYLFSGLVSMIQLAGGVNGFTQLMEKWVHSKKGSLIASWLLVPITFIDCGFRVVATGSIIKPLAKKFGVSGEQLAFTLNNSASPLISLIPFATTFIGYMLGVIAVGMKTAGISGSPFVMFLRSIPFNFFSFTAISVAIFSVFLPWKFTEKEKKLTQNNKRPILTEAFNFEMGKDEMDKSLIDTTQDQMGVALGKDMEMAEEGHKHSHKVPMSMEHDHDMEIKSKLPPRAYNLLIPIGILIPLSFFMVWLDGSNKGETLLQIFSEANASRAMFQALFITTAITALFYLLQRLTLKELTNSIIKGGNKLMVTITILALAWPIATVSRDLGLPKLIELTLGNRISAVFIPVFIFTITALVTYFVGSSWGSWALMMPLALPLAVTSGASLPLVIAAVFSGGTFGDVTSPLSGMTAMSSGIAEVEHMDYVKAMTPYNLFAGGVAATLFLVVPYLL